MKIIVHDFAGHPFQIDLSRRLAARGHEVLHVHCPSYATGKGLLEDVPGLRVVELKMATTFARYRPLQRLAQEVSYGLRFTRVTEGFGPDLIVSCNDPLIAKMISGLWCQWRRIPWVFWLQDIYSFAMAREIKKRGIAMAGLVGWCLEQIERWLLRSAGAVVAITEDFLPVLRRWHISDERCFVIENWAPIDELPAQSKRNNWRKEHVLEGKFLFLYSGTLGLKHNPDVLYELAERLGHLDAEVLVVSEGRGADRLRSRQEQRWLPNLKILPFEPFERMPEVLAAADVLVVLLEPDAGTFSVPSKVLTCLCAGRPILAMMPAENLAARTIQRAGAGTVVLPGDLGQFMREATSLMNDQRGCEDMGRNARSFAEAEFNGEAVTDRFEVALRLARGAL
jgi:glycosyltransferase involved in cell wall biosynthesis